jgi:hypothetical protein
VVSYVAGSSVGDQQLQILVNGIPVRTDGYRVAVSIGNLAVALIVGACVLLAILAVVAYLIHRRGERIAKMRRDWENARKKALEEYQIGQDGSTTSVPMTFLKVDGEEVGDASGEPRRARFVSTEELLAIEGKSS